VPDRENRILNEDPKDNRTDKRFRVSVAGKPEAPRRKQDFPAPSFDAQRATRRPDHFSPSVVALAVAVIWVISNLHS
jgi:hypothetical protein